jgi:transposase
VNNRACVEGILWVLRTGARWRDLPPQYPSPATCWRRLRRWEEQGVLLEAWRALLGTLDERGRLRWEETFLDATFFPAKKGALQSAKRSAARARKPWYWPMARVYLSEFCLPPRRRTR